MKWFPLILIFSLSGSLKSAGLNVRFRPPGWAFGLIWTVLLLMFGRSWEIAEKEDDDTYYLPTTLALASWVLLYKMSPLWASWVLIPVMALLLACYTTGTKESRLYLCPLIAWTLFATIMNTTNVQYK